MIEGVRIRDIENERAALRLDWEREEGEPETDWWEVGRPRRRDD